MKREGQRVEGRMEEEREWIPSPTEYYSRKASPGNLIPNGSSISKTHKQVLRTRKIQSTLFCANSQFRDQDHHQNLLRIHDTPLFMINLVDKQLKLKKWSFAFPFIRCQKLDVPRKREAVCVSCGLAAKSARLCVKHNPSYPRDNPRSVRGRCLRLGLVN